MKGCYVTLFKTNFVNDEWGMVCDEFHSNIPPLYEDMLYLEYPNSAFTAHKNESFKNYLWYASDIDLIIDMKFR
ncbi:hypothetical protein D3C71_1893260 [compost metagenome]